MSREEAGHSLDVQRPVREVRAGVRCTLDDPDLARSAICVVEAPAVVDRSDVVGAAMDEEEGAWLERAEHVVRAAIRNAAPRAQPQQHTCQPHERRTRELRSSPHVFDQQRSQVAERAVEHERLDSRLAGGAQQRYDRAHRVPEQSDPGIGDPLAGECDRSLQLQHFLDSERDRCPVAAGHAAIRIENHVESLAPQCGRDAEGILPLAFMPTGDDHGLGRTRLSKMPGAKVHAVRRDQLGLFVVGLKLEGREGEIVEEGRPVRDERAPVHLEGQADVEDQQARADERGVGHRSHPIKAYAARFWPAARCSPRALPRSGRARRGAG